MPPGQYYVIVRADIRNAVRETDESNNVGVSAAAINLDVPELQLGTPFSAQLSTGTEHYYKVSVPAGRDLRIAVDSVSALSANELYVRFGFPPDRGVKNTTAVGNTSTIGRRPTDRYSKGRQRCPL